MIDRRFLLSAGLGLLIWPSAAVGLSVTGLPVAGAVILAGVLLVIAAWAATSRLPDAAALVWGRGWLIAGGWAAASLLAFVMIARLSVFMQAPERDDCAVIPGSRFYNGHSCLSALTGGLERARRDQDVYGWDRAADVQGTRFRADPYMYSPPFLVVPLALSAVSDDFLALRRAWFAWQAATSLAAFLLVAVYLGGTRGVAAAMGIPAIWLAPPFLLNLQIGNAQISVLAAAMAGMVLMNSRWPIAGAGLLSLAIAGKLFPAVLVAYLVGLRRWPSVLAVAAWGLAFALAVWLVVGAGPFRDFLGALPGLQDGTAPATAIWVQDAGISVTNHSVYGATRKLAALGFRWLTPSGERLLQGGYGILVMAVALIAGVAARSRPVDPAFRLRQAVTWLALLNLASFRSPFLPDAYAYVGTFWLCSLLVASRAPLSWRRGLAFAVLWVLMMPIDGSRTLGFLPLSRALAGTLAVQVLVMGLTLACAWYGDLPPWRQPAQRFWSRARRAFPRSV